MTTESAEIALEALGASALFSDFSPIALEAITPYFVALSGTSGDRLYEQGDDSGSLYVVVSGTLNAWIRDETGRERKVARLGPSDSFGELSLVLRGDRALAVEAATPVSVLELSLDSFRTLKQQNPDLCLMLIMTIVRRFGRVLNESRDVLQSLMLRQLAGPDAQ